MPEITNLDNIKCAVDNILDKPEKRLTGQGRQILANLDTFAREVS